MRSTLIAILEEHGAPLDGTTNRQVLHWCAEHRDELPYTPVQIMKAFFPHNPQRLRDV
jgi:hypothetical protein